MHATTALLSLLATTALAAPTGQLSRRQEDCSFTPGQADQSTSTYILRIEPAGTNSSSSSNNTLGWLDALSTSHALLAPARNFASEAFNAPTWNTNRKLIFWPGNQEYERGFNIPPSALAGPESIAAVVSTPGCGTPLVDLAPAGGDSDSDSDSDSDNDAGSCGLAGQKVRARTGCPAWGTANGGDAHCTPQIFLLCDNTGLQGISDSQKALFYGAAATAQYGPNCQEVDLVSECP